MNIIVTLKQVPDPNIPPSHLAVDEAAKQVIPPPGIPPVMNGYDANAIEEALRLKEQHGGKITVVSVGDDSTREALKRAIAMGADAAILVSDPTLLDADSFSTAQALAAAIKKIGTYDLIFCGRQASDTDAGQVLHGIAERLGLPAVSPIKKVEQADPDALIVHRIVEDGYQRVRVGLPALIGISSEINEPRYPPPRGLMMAGRALIPTWTAADLGLDGVQQRVTLRRLYVEKRQAETEFIEADSAAEAGVKLADKLHEVGLI